MIYFVICMVVGFFLARLWIGTNPLRMSNYLWWRRLRGGQWEWMMAWNEWHHIKTPGDRAYVQEEWKDGKLVYAGKWRFPVGHQPKNPAVKREPIIYVPSNL